MNDLHFLKKCLIIPSVSDNMNISFYIKFNETLYVVSTAYRYVITRSARI